MASGWVALLTTAGTPPAMLQRLNAAIVKALQQKDVRDTLIANGLEPVSSTPDELRAFLASETVKWGKVISDGNIKTE